jgi:Ala-tRNA(Pro) deacylase
MPTMPARLQKYLDDRNVSYEVHPHREVFTAQEIAEVEHVPGKDVAKVVMLRDRDDFFMVVLPAPARLDLDLARGALRRPNMQLAEEEEFTHLFPDCEAGAMPPFGNLYDIPVWVDESLTNDERIVFNAGTHTQTISIPYDDFDRLVQPKVGRLALDD